MKHQVNPRRIRAAAPAAPDGGYAWFILLSCFLVFGLTFGVIKSFGVFYVEIHQYFETSATGTSWITSIAVATIHVVAPAASALSTRFSHRSVVVVGGLMCSLGVMLGSFSRSVVDLYLTVGLLNGFGYALTWTPTVTMVGMYFEKRRPLANALSSAGECIFTFVLTPLFQLLIHSYSWRGALLVLGALQLHLCVCGMLLRPLATRREHETEGGRSHPEVLSKDAPAEESVGMSEASDEEDMRKPADVTDPTDDDDDDDDNDDDDDDDGGTTGTELKSKVLRYVDYTLITNPRFMVYSMFGVFAALGFFAPALFLVPYARSRGIAEYEAAALVSISAAMDLFGRVFFGWLANLRLLQTVLQLTASVFVLATVMLLGPLCSTFAQLAVFSVAYGLAYGATVAIHITVLAEVVGVHRLGSALGFFMLLRSSGGLLGPPIAGFFIDKMSDYGMGFLMAGVALIIAALLLLILNQMNSRSPSSS